MLCIGIIQIWDADSIMYALFPREQEHHIASQSKTEGSTWKNQVSSLFSNYLWTSQAPRKSVRRADQKIKYQPQQGGSYQSYLPLREFYMPPVNLNLNCVAVSLECDILVVASANKLYTYAIQSTRFLREITLNNTNSCTTVTSIVITSPESHLIIQGQLNDEEYFLYTCDVNGFQLGQTYIYSGVVAKQQNSYIGYARIFGVNYVLTSRANVFQLRLLFDVFQVCFERHFDAIISYTTIDRSRNIVFCGLNSGDIEVLELASIVA